MPVRLIATDVDGTLLDDKGLIPADNLRAIERAREKGIAVAICSGRFPENVYVKLEEYGLRCPIIGENGARTVDENLRELAEHPMEEEAAVRTLMTLIEMGSDYFIFGRKAICTSREGMVHHSELSQASRLRQLGFSYCHGEGAAWEFVHGAVLKFFVCSNVPLEPVRRALREIPGIGLTQSGISNIEIIPEGVDKGRGVRDLAEHMGIPMTEVMALGDEENDIPMLRAAGYGIAMGNGSEETKAAARYVTASNREAGFARAVERYALAE